MDDLLAVLAVPPHAIDGIRGTLLLQHDTDRVGEPYRVVRGVARQKKHLALADDDVPEVPVVDHLEHHGALVLVEPLGSLVDVVVGAGVGAADDL